MISRKKTTPHMRVWLLLVLLVLLLIPLFLRQTATRTEANTAAPEVPEPPPIPEIRREVIKGTVAQGDTATALLSDFFSAAELHELGKKCKPVFPLSRLSAGQAYRLLSLIHI